MTNPRDIVMKAVQANPQLEQMFMSDPQKRDIFEAIKSGDSSRAQQMANSLCQQHGVTPEQGLQNAMNFFSQQGQ